jgi:hypothetical protein
VTVGAKGENETVDSENARRVIYFLFAFFTVFDEPEIFL